ncbi:MAG: adenosylcobinamide-GDP ribazoletransferase [Methanomicrobiales archaeon]|nr:adenosylcobinamide-GDP ribazoletransferase [Methanomicrobiales archaeon]
MTALVALLQWTTILPLGKPADFEQFARRSWLYPAAGYVTGGIAAVLALCIPQPLVAAAVALAAALVISGGNHFDGLLDFGDGAMAHGSREIRIRALSDRAIGAGGVLAGMLALLVSFAGLAAGPSVPAGILAGEVLGKGAMAVLTVTGKPFKEEGIHHYLHRHARPYFVLPALILCLPLAGAVPVPALAAAFVAAALVALGMQLLAGRFFNGVNGDVVGATHELVRAAVVVVLALVPAVPCMYVLS